MRLRTAAALTALTVAVTLPSLGSATPATAATQKVASVPVSFEVVNKNRTALPCQEDGKKYTVVGHVTGPAAALRKSTIRAAALYLHGDGVDERLWRYTKKADHNYAEEMAEAGFVSVTVTRLGYEGSGKPNGKDMCFGSEADVAHQIIQHLRAGTYSAKGSGLGATGKAPKMQDLVLVGHSASGFVAMAEAYTFGDIGGLVVVGSGQFVTPHVGTTVFDQQSRCFSSPDGYSFLTLSQDQAKKDFFTEGADESVAEDISATRPKDACGPLMYALGSFVVDPVKVRSISIPVLCIAGDKDAFFPRPDDQAKLFAGSSDVKSVVVPNTGHAITLEKSAPDFRKAMASWLAARQFAAS